MHLVGFFFKKWRLISGFRRDVNEICDLLWFFAAQNGNSVPTFRDNLSRPLKLTAICPETELPTLRCVKSQKSADLMKFPTSEVECATLLRPKNIPRYTINKLVKAMGENERSEASWATIVVRVRKWAKWSFMSYHCSSGAKMSEVKLHELSLYFGWENERSEASWAIIVVRVRKSREFCDRYGTQQTEEQSEMNTNVRKFTGRRGTYGTSMHWGRVLRWIVRNCGGIVEHCNDPSTSAKELLGWQVPSSQLHEDYVTGIRTGKSRNCGSIPGRGKRFWCSSKRPDPLCDLPSFLLSEHRG